MQLRLVPLAPRIVTGAALVGSSAWAWATSYDAGATATTIGIVGLAAIGLGVQIVRQVGAALTEFQLNRTKAFADLQATLDRANEGSLSRQLADLKADSEKMRATLHDVRDEASAERLRHMDENERLTEQLRITTDELRGARDELHATREELRAAHDENRRLLLRVEQVARGVATNARDIAEVRAATEGETESGPGEAK